MENCFFIVSLAAVVTYAFGQYTYRICDTDECKTAASEILANLNRTVDPCDDFYKFACGGWIQNNPVNESCESTDRFQKLEIKTEDQLRELLEEPIQANDTISLRKAKHIFSQCMDHYNEDVNINTFSESIREYINWPLDMLFDDKKSQNLTWQNVSNSLLENGYDNGLFDIHVWIDAKMSNSNVISIVEPTFLNQLNKSFSLSEMYEFIMGIAKSFTKKNDETIIKEVTNDTYKILSFAIELAKLKDPNINYKYVDTFYVPLTIQQLQKEYDKQHPEKKGKIDWHQTIQSAFASVEIAIEPSEKLVVAAYKYLTHLVPLLEQTSPRTIVQYMLWTVFMSYTQLSNADFIARIVRRDMMSYYAYNTELNNDQKWREKCLDERNNLQHAISHEYVKKYASHINVQALREMGSDIKDVVRTQITQSTWMDELTKQVNLEKLEYMIQEYIKPAWYSDETIDNYYTNLTVNMTYRENIRNVRKLERMKEKSRLRDLVDRTLWTCQPTTVNAEYNDKMNKLMCPAAVLQTPIYNENRLSYMNYGSLGLLFGHETNHGYDDEGRQYNKDGNSGYWWSTSSIDAYQNKTQCFIDQYNNYLVPGLDDNTHVDGKKTLNENIADSAGIVSAYYAYQNRKARRNEPEIRAQGLEEYSDDQILFITSAQILCTNALQCSIRKHTSSPHSPNELRVRGCLSNSREFSAAFNCSAGKPMNPERKCTLWQ